MLPRFCRCHFSILRADTRRRHAPTRAPRQRSRHRPDAAEAARRARAERAAAMRHHARPRPSRHPSAGRRWRRYAEMLTGCRRDACACGRFMPDITRRFAYYDALPDVCFAPTFLL